jgi:hypothetical protein
MRDSFTAAQNTIDTIDPRETLIAWGRPGSTASPILFGPSGPERFENKFLPLATLLHDEPHDCSSGRKNSRYKQDDDGALDAAMRHSLISPLRA